MFNTTTANPPKNNKLCCIAKGDSAASHHFWKESDASMLKNIHNKKGPPVTLPNAETINDTKVGFLPGFDMLSDISTEKFQFNIIRTTRRQQLHH